MMDQAFNAIGAFITVPALLAMLLIRIKWTNPRTGKADWEMFPYAYGMCLAAMLAFCGICIAFDDLARTLAG